MQGGTDRPIRNLQELFIRLDSTPRKKNGLFEKISDQIREATTFNAELFVHHLKLNRYSDVTQRKMREFIQLPSSHILILQNIRHPDLLIKFFNYLIINDQSRLEPVLSHDLYYVVRWLIYNFPPSAFENVLKEIYLALNRDTLKTLLIPECRLDILFYQYRDPQTYKAYLEILRKYMPEVIPEFFDRAFKWMLEDSNSDPLKKMEILFYILDECIDSKDQDVLKIKLEMAFLESDIISAVIQSSLSDEELEAFFDRLIKYSPELALTLFNARQTPTQLTVYEELAKYRSSNVLISILQKVQVSAPDELPVIFQSNIFYEATKSKHNIHTFVELLDMAMKLDPEVWGEVINVQRLSIIKGLKGLIKNSAYKDEDIEAFFDNFIKYSPETLLTFFDVKTGAANTKFTIFFEALAEYRSSILISLLQKLKDHAPNILLVIFQSAHRTYRNIFFKAAMAEDSSTAFKLLHMGLGFSPDELNKVNYGNILHQILDQRIPDTENLMAFLESVIEQAPDIFFPLLLSINYKTLLDRIISKMDIEEHVLIELMKDCRVKSQRDACLANPENAGRLSKYFPQESHVLLLNYIENEDIDSAKTLLRSSFEFNPVCFIDEFHRKFARTTLSHEQKAAFQRLFKKVLKNKFIDFATLSKLYDHCGIFDPCVEVEPVEKILRKDVSICCHILFKALGMPQPLEQYQKEVSFFVTHQRDQALLEKLSKLLDPEHEFFMVLLSYALVKEEVSDALYHVYSWQKLPEEAQEKCLFILEKTQTCSLLEKSMAESLVKQREIIKMTDASLSQTAATDVFASAGVRPPGPEEGAAFIGEGEGSCRFIP